MDGKEHTFLEDGDEVTITAWATTSDGTRLGLGAVTGRSSRAEPSTPGNDRSRADAD